MNMAGQIVFIGDSLTQWFNWQGRFPEYVVANLGISGETVDELLARLEYIRSLVDNPDYIFIMSGINNIANQQFRILEPYREVVRNLTKCYKKSKVVVQSILPVDLPWINNNIIIDINLNLEKIAIEYASWYLDIYRNFVDSNGNIKKGYLSNDGVHLANRGYAVWAYEVQKFLKK
jgi:lysophospholipase L1-like esterase